MKQIGHERIDMVDFIEQHLLAEKVPHRRLSKTLIEIDDGYEDEAEEALLDEEFVAAVHCKALGFEVRRIDA